MFLRKFIRVAKQIIPFNKVIQTLIVSDFILFFGWGLVSPILAIFIADKIKGGNVQVAGTAVGVYWLIKSLAQLPIAHYLDKNHGEKDDYYAMFGGTLAASFVSLGFIFASLPWHIYALEACHGLAMAFVLPSYSAIFTRHLDRGKEALSWGMDSCFLGIGSGLAGILGGIGAEIFGFTPLFLGVFVFGAVASLLLLIILNDLKIRTRDGKAPFLKPEF